MQNHRSKKKPYTNIAPRYQTGGIVKKSKIDKKHPHWTLSGKLGAIGGVMALAKEDGIPWSEIPPHRRDRYFDIKGVSKIQSISPAEAKYLPPKSPWWPYLKLSSKEK